MTTNLTPETRSARRRKAERWDDAQAELIYEIVETATRIAAARTLHGEPIIRTEPVWLLLRALERSTYCCSISEVGRSLQVSRQHAQTLWIAQLLLGLDRPRMATATHVVRVIRERLTREERTRGR